MFRIKNSVNKALDKFGLRIISKYRMEPGTKCLYLNPVAASYYYNTNPYLAQIALSNCRILQPIAFSCDKDEYNPFLQTIGELESKRNITYRESSLYHYYNSWQPESAQEVLGLPNSSQLKRYSSLSAVMPWEPISPINKDSQRKSAMQRDAGEHGMQMKKFEGWIGWGPVTEQIGELQMYRLTKVVSSIKKYGYKPGLGEHSHIVGRIISHGGDYRCLISPGNHRACALAYLNYENVEIEINQPIVRRAEVRYWPNVRNSTFTESEALEVFDRVFAGGQPWL